MAELADALDSGSSEDFLHAGSSPVIRTISSVRNQPERLCVDTRFIFAFIIIIFLCSEQVFKPALLFYADLVIYSTATPFRVSAL